MEEKNASTTTYEVQLISEEDKKWPSVGYARVNKNGSINVYLKPGASIEGGKKLYLSPSKPKTTEGLATKGDDAPADGRKTAA